MRGRRETELPPFIETGVLRVDVKTEGACIAQGGLQGGFASQDKGKPRHSFDALVGRRHEEVDVLKINWNSAEAAHGIHDERPVFTLVQ